jgi:23S rRNA pseudouridine2605 synthase
MPYNQIKVESINNSREFSESENLENNNDLDGDANKVRLNKALAKVTGLSRRQIDNNIASGKVVVNGSIAILGMRVDLEQDKIEYYDSKGNLKTLENLTAKGDKVVLIYKPVFTVTTRFDPQDRKTVYDFIPREFAPLKTAGRLDYMSEGLLVMTNNGELIQELTHPSHSHIKKYLVGLARKLESKYIDMAGSGELEIDEYKLNPVNIKVIKDATKYEYLKLNGEFFWYTFELSEGRNNQIRRMIEVFGNSVKRLVRVQHGEHTMTEELWDNKYVEMN